MKTIDYWKKNAEEDYINTPISVLRYVSELEELNHELLEACEDAFDCNWNDVSLLELERIKLKMLVVIKKAMI